ncbi:MAG: ABC transporter ATP-binding protein [Phycisphaerales bacterium]|nr:ABC transporter ATP-binding protein [Phycisphaerales bacterium]
MADLVADRSQRRVLTREMLRVSGLKVSFGLPPNLVCVVHGVDLEIAEGEILGLVGESGSGKSVSCLAIMRLLAYLTQVEGRVEFEGTNLLAIDTDSMVRLRGRKIAMIFQDATSALNPVKTIGWQICEAIRINGVAPDSRRPRSDAWVEQEALRLLKEVGMPDPDVRLGEYPHQLSGGMNQRALIAMMLAGNPRLLIADEPTTALDVTIQAQTLRLLRVLRERRGMSIILITHDLGVVAETCDRVAVMYCGRIVEMGSVEAVFRTPRHPYTIGLLNSRPRIDREIGELQPIEGIVPSPMALPRGCSFAPRCSRALDRCREQIPSLEPDASGHAFACFHPVGRQV